jgi:hypothetical protein
MALLGLKLDWICLAAAIALGSSGLCFSAGLAAPI